MRNRCSDNSRSQSPNVIPPKSPGPRYFRKVSRQGMREVVGERCLVVDYTSVLENGNEIQRAGLRSQTLRYAFKP